MRYAHSQSSSSNSIPPGINQVSGAISRNSSRHRNPVLPPPIYMNNNVAMSTCATALNPMHPPNTNTGHYHHNHSSQASHQAMADVVSEHGANNFATIRTTSIVTKQQKEHMQVKTLFIENPMSILPNSHVYTLYSTGRDA